MSTTTTKELMGLSDEIKVVINNRNRLTTTRNMVEQLLRLNHEEKIIIIDNGSTYQPLLQWYGKIKHVVDVRMNRNEGHLALWVSKIHLELGSFFVYTDSDIEINDKFPASWKSIMLQYIGDYRMDKVALALRIDDLPEHYRYRNQVKRNEGRWWLNEVEPCVYEADTDTTFCLMRNIGDNCYKSIRLAHDNMIARHAPWYTDLDNLDEEEQYYLDNHERRFHTQYTIQHINPEKFNDI